MERQNEPMKVSTLFQREEEWRDAVKRITGRTMDEWDKRHKARIVNDISKGKLDPSRWIPISRITPFCTLYALGDDDLVVAQVDSEIVERDNPGYVAPEGYYNGQTRPAQTVTAARLNPDKYDALSGMYKKWSKAA